MLFFSLSVSEGMCSVGMTSFGQDLENQAAHVHSHKNFPGVPPPPPSLHAISKRSYFG